MAKKKPKCLGCKQRFTKDAPAQKYCRKCRPAKPPKSKKGKRGKSKLVGRLVEEALAYGEERAQGMVNQAILTLREELIKARHENAKMREELELAAIGEG